MNWIHEHRAGRPYAVPKEWNGNPEYGGDYYQTGVIFSRQTVDDQLLLADQAFNNHEFNDGKAVSPYDEGRVDYGVDNLEVRLIQGIDEAVLRNTLRRTIRATNGVHPNEPPEETDPMEMFRGGLQTALESQVVVFEVIGASRVLTHQLVRSRRAAFHQQSQRATWYGDRPNQRWPMSIKRVEQEWEPGPIPGTRMPTAPSLQDLWEEALLACWAAYKAACDAGVSYQDARYILPEGTTNYILCEYPLREFINVFAYRGCSMFQWEMVQCAREMRRVLLEAHPFLEPYVKISCEKTGKTCERCKGSGWLWSDGIAADPYEVEEPDRRLSAEPLDMSPCADCQGVGAVGRRCTFQGWENVERQCDFPWAKQSNRVFLPSPRNRIG